MGFKAITINTDASAAAHILAQDDANLYNAIFGTDCVLDIDSKMAASIISNNLIRIAPGACVVQGHFGRIPYGEYVDIPIENGTSGKYRNDIIVVRFSTSSGIDTFKLDVVKGTPGATATDPTVTIGDLNKGDTLREFALFRVKLNGLSITAVESVFSIGTSLKVINNNLAGKLLWKNPSPTSSFAAQTINWGSESNSGVQAGASTYDFDMLEIFFSYYIDQSLVHKSVRITKNTKAQLDMIAQNGGGNMIIEARDANNVNKTIEFTNCYVQTSTGNTWDILNQDNKRCIPTHIVGYKTGVFF